MQTFKKKERITEKKIILELFEKGNEFYVSPIRALWLVYPSAKPFTLKILIAVSNRNFKKAVERNYIKRLIREAFRKNKQTVYEKMLGKPENIMLALQYTGKIILPYKDMEEKIKVTLQRLLKEYEKTVR
ncbi:MAG TPA: ribonuclease P protein component [Bacteroidales bacterium]|nr:ribonuclease P protein component [Bacteroidales bacterium]HPS16028.1 ribonuclease P protein component [Bacteroidales bacterium]